MRQQQRRATQLLIQCVALLGQALPCPVTDCLTGGLGCACRYDGDHDGRLSRTEFEGLLNEYLRAKQQQAANNNNPPTPASQPQQQQPAAAPALPPAPSYAPPSALPPPPTTPAPAPPAHPGAVPPSSSSSSFTHYDETSGLPLPSDAVYRYGALYGHKVVPLAEAYDRRMHRLQVGRAQAGRQGARLSPIDDDGSSSSSSHRGSKCCCWCDWLTD